ncbi:MAG: hypothetical protein ACRDIB_18630 [Ardenticatenaceae bacterium]
MSNDTPPPLPAPRPWLIAGDWQSRALLLAELQERGIEMRAEAGMRWATHALIHERLAPPLILLVTHRDPEATPERLAGLLAILAEDGSTPELVLLVGAYDRVTWDEAFGDRAFILFRPAAIGEVAKVVQRSL